MKMKKIQFSIFITISIALLILLFFSISKIERELLELDIGGDSSLEEFCNLNSGKWVLEQKECEGISKENCENSGGTFDECASACRNNPGAELCIAMCVPVCKYQ